MSQDRKTARGAASGVFTAFQFDRPVLVNVVLALEYSHSLLERLRLAAAACGGEVTGSNEDMAMLRLESPKVVDFLDRIATLGTSSPIMSLLPNPRDPLSRVNVRFRR